MEDNGLERKRYRWIFIGLKKESSFFNSSLHLCNPDVFKLVCVADNFVHGLSREHSFRHESKILIKVASFSFSLPFRSCDPKAPPLLGVCLFRSAQPSWSVVRRMRTHLGEEFSRVDMKRKDEYTEKSRWRHWGFNC